MAMTWERNLSRGGRGDSVGGDGKGMKRKGGRETGGEKGRGRYGRDELQGEGRRNRNGRGICGDKAAEIDKVWLEWEKEEGREREIEVEKGRGS